ncbi:CGNR zinc finger domain-containing protein [Actinophytocola sp.]|uniref:CGNR zinc finger domain-containing protein n=1 Tax=Actinophytocola sp. TaxID=1872138 RepID=UPI002D7F56B9|nr:CGNR zinc finger domain-containing protein [Actinophytocola sp.]HET9140118.1 CGNR zinc finger domain-containing protein [Actinophytocola sp.]
MVRESSELILRWDSGAVFGFDAGALCLELLTTGGVAAHPGTEALHTPADLAGWLAESRLRLAGARVAAVDVPATHRLRAALWAAATAVTTGRPVPEAAVATINEAAATTPPTPVLAAGRRTWAEATTAGQALSAIARDAVELFGGPYAARIRECAAANCLLVFVDLSRPGQRRWCSMERCGNRAKQRTRHGRS